MSKVNDWEPTEENLAKLPKSVARYIRTEQSHVENLKARLDEVSNGGPADSPVRSMSHIYPDVPLGDATVDFFPNESRERWDDMVEVRVRDGQVSIDMHGKGRNIGVIQPVSSQHFVVYFVERP